jgi:hypothetical protein
MRNCLHANQRNIVDAENDGDTRRNRSASDAQAAEVLQRVDLRGVVPSTDDRLSRATARIKISYRGTDLFKHLMRERTR